MCLSDDKVFSKIFSADFLHYLNQYKLDIVSADFICNKINNYKVSPSGLMDYRGKNIYLTHEKDWKTLAHEVGHVVYYFLLDSGLNFNLLNEAYLKENKFVTYYKHKSGPHYLKLHEFIAQAVYLLVLDPHYFKSKCKYLQEIFILYNVTKNKNPSNLIHIDVKQELATLLDLQPNEFKNDLVVSKVICVIHHYKARMISFNLRNTLIQKLVGGV